MPGTPQLYTWDGGLKVETRVALGLSFTVLAAPHSKAVKRPL